jgi:DNA-binding response OmpR family regulator
MQAATQVLIIDDDAGTVRLLVELLRGRGFGLRVALDGRDGYEKAIEHQPDVILLDVSMPQLDGYRVCRLLKDDPRTRDIPVIFLTGKDGPGDRLDGFDAGCSDYVVKPYQADELVARIRVHQDMRRRLLALHEDRSVPEAGHGPVDPESDRLVAAAQDLLRQRIGEPPILVELARRIGSNERTLTERFRRQLGVPVFAWLREERFRRACDLLATTGQGVAEIATAVGHTNASAFTTAFRERYGLTPSAYRRSAGLAPGAASVCDALNSKGS